MHEAEKGERTKSDRVFLVSSGKGFELDAQEY